VNDAGQFCTAVAEVAERQLRARAALEGPLRPEDAAEGQERDELFVAAVDRELELGAERGDRGVRGVGVQHVLAADLDLVEIAVALLDRLDQLDQHLAALADALLEFEDVFPDVRAVADHVVALPHHLVFGEGLDRVQRQEQVQGAVGIIVRRPERPSE
jgi:hypothetical protein